ncbi:hypothetical protein [Catalinimonas niigatensis]|uniref:hypothetical protein n=1 Tax=Catalinimonas niigatensis TaxID=1397264 RepID=UPI0026662FE0|nr:hypothetical protein [Catalinimonas niigatensis]WPP48038.1 hypothetical protein PZB72_15270 [Catalinimonas niigatensis]
MENQANSWTNRTRKNTARLAYWTAAWVVTMAVASFSPKFIGPDSTILFTLTILANLLAGAGMIVANIRYIKALDEMQQKIQLEAMGIALGVGVVGGLSYSLLDLTNLISGNAEIGFLVIMISVSYLIAIFVGHFRYQ